MAVSQMDKVTQSNAASAEENAASSEELNAQALTLQEVVAQLQAIIIGQKEAQAAQAASNFPATPKRKPAPFSNRDNAAFTFGSKAKPTTSKAAPTQDFQNF